MNWLLRHNFWMVKLLGLVVITALLANTTTTVVALVLLSGASSPSRTPPEEDDDEVQVREPADPSDGALAGTTRNDNARRAERAAERILGRNVFCPTCGPTPDPESADDNEDEAPDDLSKARRTQLPLVVAATMEHIDPEQSLATLVDTQHGVGGLFGVGDLLGDDIRVVRVAPGLVHILNHGAVEYIPFEPLAAAPPPSAGKDKGKPAPRPSPKPPKDHGIEGAADAIQCGDKGSCVVERAFVEKLIANPKLLLGQGGASPTTTKDGSPGFRLRGVRRGTLPDLLGLKNGDVITEVGGSPLTMETAMGLYSKLRHASHVEVTVDRRGSRVQRQLEIRS